MPAPGDRVFRPNIRTMEPHEANPYHLAWAQLRTKTIQLAAALARDGRGEAAKVVQSAYDSMPHDLPGVPRRREDGR
jgi:hypothetical protein